MTKGELLELLLFLWDELGLLQIKGLGDRRACNSPPTYQVFFVRVGLNVEHSSIMVRGVEVLLLEVVRYSNSELQAKNRGLVRARVIARLVASGLCLWCGCERHVHLSYVHNLSRYHFNAYHTIRIIINTSRNSAPRIDVPIHQSYQWHHQIAKNQHRMAALTSQRSCQSYQRVRAASQPHRLVFYDGIVIR